MKTGQMKDIPYQVGMGVVHPVHGAGLIKGIEDILIPGGEMRKYLLVSLFHKGLMVKIPAHPDDELAIRHVADDHQMEECLRVLKTAPKAIRQRWNREHSDNLKKLKSGNLQLVAEVARDLLARKEKAKGRLSILDDKLLTSVVEQICGEIDCYLGIKGEKKVVDESMQEVCQEILAILQPV
ncbi:hypothetical protein H8D30_00700 [bacterium]|nr:hypothetical protein [bacterium]